MMMKANTPSPRKKHSPLLINLSIIILSACLSLIALDIIARPLLRNRLYYRPNDMFCNKYPPLPLIPRYTKNAFYKGETFGDLAQITGKKEYRETRKTVFQTDAYGFRNSLDAKDKQIDVVMLGDSVGAGVGSSQDKTWSTILQNKYGLKVYNLSVPGTPWTELMNLKLEIARLKLNKNSVVLWAIFPGNDLTGPYGDQLSPDKLNNAVQRAAVAWNTFKQRSPVKQLLQKLFPDKNAGKNKDLVAVKKTAGGEKVLFYLPYQWQGQLSEDQVKQHPSYPKLRKVFKEMKKFSKENNLNIATIIIPSKEEVYAWLLEDNSPAAAEKKPSALSAAFQQICRKEGFAMLDMKPYFVEEAKRLYAKEGKLLWWRDDTHWNEAGHAFAASVAYKHLLAQRKAL